MKRFRPLEWVLAVFALLVVAAICFPVFAYDGIRAPDSTCLWNVKQSSLGLVMYAADENDRLPLRDRWMDATLPYVKQEGIWHCPLVPKGVYGYAYNGVLSGTKQTLFDAPGSVPMVYDSVNPIRNASDLCASLPLPGRHGRKEGGGSNTVGFVDGHAKSVPARAVAR